MHDSKTTLNSIWADPVWSKVISAIIIAAGTGTLVWINGLLRPTDPFQILTAPVELWVIPCILILEVFVRWIWQYLRRPKYIWVRMDDINPGMKVVSVSYRVGTFDTVNQLIDRLAYDEDLTDFEIGKDWEIATPIGHKWITERSDKPLKEFGVVPGSEVEIVTMLSKEGEERLNNRARRLEMCVLE